MGKISILVKYIGQTTKVQWTSHWEDLIMSWMGNYMINIKQSNIKKQRNKQKSCGFSMPTLWLAQTGSVWFGGLDMVKFQWI